MLTLLSLTTLAATLTLGCACHTAKRAEATYVRPVRLVDASGPAAAPRPREVARGDLRATLLLLERIQFGFDTATLLPQSRASLERAAAGLAAHPTVTLYIDGHSDERGTTEYNLALGQRRAQAVVDHLVRLAISPERLVTVSFGEERPRREGDDAEALAMNRRVEFRMMRGVVPLMLEDGPLVGDDGRRLDQRTAVAP